MSKKFNLGWQLTVDMQEVFEFALKNHHLIDKQVAEHLMLPLNFVNGTIYENY